MRRIKKLYERIAMLEEEKLRLEAAVAQKDLEIRILQHQVDKQTNGVVEEIDYNRMLQKISRN